jgi:predicted enzyme related to lactoylglutathione lyase
MKPMKCTQFCPVIQTNDVAAVAKFYIKNFRFKAAFESDWYMHLQSAEDASVNIAVLQGDHETIPEAGRGATANMLINFEVEDVDAEYAKAVANGVPILKSLHSEPYGQRHCIAQDPEGVLIDVITPIPPSAEFADGFSEDALKETGA